MVVAGKFYVNRVRVGFFIFALIGRNLFCVTDQDYVREADFVILALQEFFDIVGGSSADFAGSYQECLQTAFLFPVSEWLGRFFEFIGGDNYQAAVFVYRGEPARYSSVVQEGFLVNWGIDA